ncbi:hypothetical protein H0H93_011609 [Arthromyces matolae]|nr:hypothetical protein H0H93_011609 [Arthromyces matolae]
MVSDFKSQRKVLFAICRVCSTWRTVALGSPFLWSNVFFDCPLFDVGWVNEAISRSQKTELSIEATIYDLSTFANFKKVLQENITRIRSMAILSANRLLEELCFSLTIEPTILQNLTLEALHEFVMPPPIKVPPSFVPRLRTLVLSKCWISFESPLFRHTYLTTLVIEGDLGTPASFVELLRSFPKLQTLQLDRQKGTLMTPMSSSNAPPVKSVHLAELRTFTLSADNLTAQTVLSLLQIPRDANLRLEISLQCHIDLDFFADEFHRSVTGTDEIRSLSLGRVNDNIEMRVWPSDNLQVGDDSRVTMILSTVGSYWQRNLLLLFETFLGSFIFDHLEVLHVHDVEFTRDNWRSIFGPLPSLKTIRVQETKFALQHELRLALDLFKPSSG